MYSRPTINGEEYAVAFTDDFSRESFVYLMKTKGAKEVYAAFQQMVATVKARGVNHGCFANIRTIITPADIQPKTVFRSDNDKAFVGKLGKYLSTRQVTQETHQ